MTELQGEICCHNSQS